MSENETQYLSLTIRELNQMGWDYNALMDYLFYEGEYYEANSSVQDPRGEEHRQANG